MGWRAALSPGSCRGWALKVPLQDQRKVNCILWGAGAAWPRSGRCCCASGAGRNERKPPPKAASMAAELCWEVAAGE